MYSFGGGGLCVWDFGSVSLLGGHLCFLRVGYTGLASLSIYPKPETHTNFCKAVTLNPRSYILKAVSPKP